MYVSLYRCIASRFSLKLNIRIVYYTVLCIYYIQYTHGLNVLTVPSIHAPGCTVGRSVGRWVGGSVFERDK